MKYLKLNKMSNSSSSTGISFFGLLGIVFIIFKLTHIIDWSWWLILLPLYGSLIIGIIVYLIIMWIVGR